MGLALIGTPDPQEQRYNRLMADLHRINERAAKAEKELREERQKNASLESGADKLRQALNPLYTALRIIFGELEGMGISGESTAPVARNSAVWESWKSKLTGSAAKAIDALMLHGEMTAEQLRIHLGCATRTCYNIIGELNRAKLINKNGGRISLKEL